MWHLGRTFINQPDRDADVRVTWPLLRRVFSYFIPYWRHALVVLICIIVGSTVSLVPAFVTKTLIDTALKPGADYRFVVVVVAAGVVAALFDGLLGVLQSYMRNLISEGIMFDLRNQLFDHLLKQSVAFFTKSRTGDVMSRIQNDVNAVQSVVSDTIFNLISNIFMLLGTLVAMFVLSPLLMLVSIAVLPLFILPTRRVGQATFDVRKQSQAKIGEVNSYLSETLGISGMLLVKAFVKGRIERSRFRKLTDDLRRINIRATMIGRWFFMLLGFLGSGGPAILWLVGGYLVVTGHASVGTVVTFATVLLGRLYGPVSSLASLHVNVIGSLAVFQRIFEYLDLPVEIAEAPDAVELGEAEGALAFDGVTFSYTGKGRPALDKVDFSVEPGQLVALVGPSGAGKTTVTSLIPRFYDPQKGVIKLDDHDIRKLTLESLGRQIGIVFQDTFLFHASVRDNLLYARPEATDDDIVVAARAANIHDFIDSLPDGYNTLVGERGHRLSGGEKQRIAIARVILKNPRVLILDEATSNLDSESERLIQAALKPLFRGRTSIVIAHRLSTILAADKILVFDRGKLVEQGTHFELLERGGTYARLYRTQFETETLQAV
jgi:ATP-binding cassette, subfamily B, bacterial